MENMQIYNEARAVPADALKQIQGGRLKGKSDINPMWRIKKLTELFGPCGIGWKYVITGKRLENGANGETAAFLDIDLFIKADGQWSEAIPGTGGSMLVQKEKSGPYTNDECFKMALTDAISVACKALGVAADVYWEKDRTKYDAEPVKEYRCCDCGKPFEGFTAKSNGKQYTAAQAYHMSEKKHGRALCGECAAKAKEAEHE